MSCLGGSFINMQSLTDVPFVADVYDESMDFWMETAERCKAILKSICDGIVDEFIPFQYNKSPESSNDKVSYMLYFYCIVANYVYFRCLNMVRNF